MRTGYSHLRLPALTFDQGAARPVIISPTFNHWHKKHAMLSLTRRSGEEIIIDTVTGEQIIVAPTRIEGNQARIGIKAPKRFEILRREVLERQMETAPA